MKELHLICEAHLDPIWLWEWEEGASAAISTFQSAVNLAKDFDYIFCHNEVTLYKYVEEYAPELFRQIQELVKQGKWHIMGGWYLQPDCNMPSGESFVRQILVGRRYFASRFGIKPTTAINFDSFGHTRGLVQIIKKCGQDSYVFCRPFGGQMALPDSLFWWEGFDGSRIKTFRSPTYNSAPFGHARGHIEDVLNGEPNRETWMVLWGVGNHGGGPSRVDLQNIESLIADRKDTVKIVHSTPETFFENVNMDNAPVVKSSLRPSMPGCYVSMSKMKSKHILTENTLFWTEKLMALTSLAGLNEYPQESFDQVEEDLLTCQFHDLITGDMIQSGEENAMSMLYHSLFILNRLRAKGIFAMASAEPVAAPGEYPFIVFNPHPYEITADVECEFGLADQNTDDSRHSVLTMYDGEKVIPSQYLREEANLNMDWRKRVIFRATVPPMSVKRFSGYITFTDQKPEIADAGGKNFVFDNGRLHAEIDRKTGHLVSYRVDGTDYITEDAFVPYLYKDNADPYAMLDFQVAGLGSDPEEILPVAEGQGHGVLRDRRSFQIVEDGPVVTSVECIYAAQDVGVRVLYVFHKTEIRTEIRTSVLWNEKDRMLKLRVPVHMPDCKLIGETAYGSEVLPQDGQENPVLRYIAMRPAEAGKPYFGILNNCMYGCSAKGNVLYLSLVRGAAYGAHPFEGRPICPDRFRPIIDLGEDRFTFGITICAEEAELARHALEFNQPMYAMNLFPAAGDKKKLTLPQISISNPDIIMTVFKKCETGEGYVIRLFNDGETERDGSFRIGEEAIALHFGKYEIKTLLYRGGKLTESPEIII